MSTPHKTHLILHDKAKMMCHFPSWTVPLEPVCFIILWPTSIPGCFSERTAVPPILRSGRRHARHPMAAQGRAWTRSACPPVTPAARQTARASLPLTALIPSRTRWILTSVSVLIIIGVIFCVCENLKLQVCVPAAFRILFLYIPPLHGHRLLHSQCLRDSRLSLPSRASLHTQAVFLPHTHVSQLAQSDPSLQHTGPRRVHHTSQPGARQREPLQEHTGKRRNSCDALSVHVYMYVETCFCSLSVP